MKKKKMPKKSWGAMTPAELAEATKEFDHPLPQSYFRPLTKAEREEWKRIMRAGARGREIVNSLHVDPGLLSQAQLYARRMKISINDVIELGIRKVIGRKRV
jgi:hypothetical protein